MDYIFKMCCPQIKSNTTFHCETNGQNEKINKIMEDMFKMNLGKKEKVVIFVQIYLQWKASIVVVLVVVYFLPCTVNNVGF